MEMIYLKVAILAVAALNVALVAMRWRPKSEKHVAAAGGTAARLCRPRSLVALSCGAKVVQLEPHDVDNTAIGEFDAQSEAVRIGGAFFECYAGCPYLGNCPRQKAFADFHLGEDVRVPLEYGLFIELQRDNGRRYVAVVGKPDEEAKAIRLAGVTFSCGGKRYTTVPPLMQQVEYPNQDVKPMVKATNN